MAKQLTAAFFLFCFSLAAFAADQPLESYRVYLENKSSGRIAASLDQGKAWVELGKVIIPANGKNDDAYTASQWIKTGEVAATAINGIHLKAEGSKAVFSILPKEFLSTLNNYYSYRNSRSSIYTDIPMNSAIFGGGFSPYVGSRYLVNGEEVKPGFTPKTGDWLMLIVSQPREAPAAIIFQNKYQGKVSMIFDDGREETIAYVLRPVLGVGRFSGSQYLPAGRIRANHAGVIDVSTSSPPLSGGFQIVPSGHAESKEMKKYLSMNQWMVVGPANLEGAPLEGIAPLFRGYLRPAYNEDDLLAPNWEDRLMGHFLVDVKIEGRWSPMPVYAMAMNQDLPKEANTFLRNVEEIRILFPQNYLRENVIK